jgi:hypothetical protein
MGSICDTMFVSQIDLTCDNRLTLGSSEMIIDFGMVLIIDPRASSCAVDCLLPVSRIRNGFMIAGERTYCHREEPGEACYIVSACKVAISGCWSGVQNLLETATHLHRTEMILRQYPLSSLIRQNAQTLGSPFHERPRLIEEAKHFDNHRQSRGVIADQQAACDLSRRFRNLGY